MVVSLIAFCRRGDKGLAHSTPVLIGQFSDKEAGNYFATACHKGVTLDGLCENDECNEEFARYKLSHFRRSCDQELFRPLFRRRVTLSKDPRFICERVQLLFQSLFASAERNIPFPTQSVTYTAGFFFPSSTFLVPNRHFKVPGFISLFCTFFSCTVPRKTQETRDTLRDSW